MDGVGPENNPNPPLAKSEWLIGKPDRAIAAVMHGLKGPIEVAGGLYNLQMPPQGAMLNDTQLASILTHVRKSWGNKEKKPVQPEQVAKVRAKWQDRKDYFTAGELKKHYPIRYRQGWPRLEKLIASVYEGKWETMPDFSQLKPSAVEEETRNLVDVAHAGAHNKEFAIVWEGDIVTRKEGDYSAKLDASDGARLFINGNHIVSVDGVGPRGTERARERRFRMKKGKNTFRLEYFNNQGNPGLSLKMGGPTGAPWLSESRLTVNPTPPPIMLVPEKGGAVMHRHFLSGARPKVMGVGYDGGVNQAFTVTHLGPDLIWRGAFLDGGKHWTERGAGGQKPAGKDVVQLLTRPGWAVLKNEKQSWPKRGEGSLATRYRGYKLDATRRPHFKYELEQFQVVDFCSAGSEEKPTLVRELTLNGVPPEKLYLALAVGPKVEEVSSGVFKVDGKVTIQVDGPSSAKPLLGPGKPQSLILPVTEAGTITVRYQW